jgi:hypothetical protein
MSSEGTSLEALESNEITNSADASRVQAILRDMNASGADVMEGSQQQGPPMQPMPSLHPMNTLPPPIDARQMDMAPRRLSSQYIPVEEAPRKPSLVSGLAERVRDPLFVTVLMFVLSLPMLHTALNKHASWAFAVGGQLSWIGLITLSIVAGLLFGIYKTTVDIFGL